MKREYRFSSILWIMIIVGLTNYLLYRLITALGDDNFILEFVGDLITGIIAFVFTFSISSGLICVITAGVIAGRIFYNF